MGQHLTCFSSIQQHSTIQQPKSRRICCLLERFYFSFLNKRNTQPHDDEDNENTTHEKVRFSQADCVKWRPLRIINVRTYFNIINLKTKTQICSRKIKVELSTIDVEMLIRPCRTSWTVFNSLHFNGINHTKMKCFTFSFSELFFFVYLKQTQNNSIIEK